MLRARAAPSCAERPALWVADEQDGGHRLSVRDARASVVLRTQAWAAIWTASQGQPERRGVGQVEVADPRRRSCSWKIAVAAMSTRLAISAPRVPEQLHAEQPPGVGVAGDADGDAVAPG